MARFQVLSQSFLAYIQDSSSYRLWFQRFLLFPLFVYHIYLHICIHVQRWCNLTRYFSKWFIQPTKPVLFCWMGKIGTFRRAQKRDCWEYWKMLGHFHEKHHLRAWLLHRRSPSLPTWSAEVRTVPGSLKSFGGQQEDVRYGFATGFDKAEISEILWKDVCLHVFADSYLWTDCFCCVTYLRNVMKEIVLQSHTHTYEKILFAISCIHISMTSKRTHHLTSLRTTIFLLHVQSVVWVFTLKSDSKCRYVQYFLQLFFRWSKSVRTPNGI